MRRGFLVALTLVLTAACAQKGNPAPANTVDVIKTLTVRQVAPLTGPDATTPTKAVDICGTDLGIPASLNGTLYLAFGDTFGYNGDICKPFGPNWRSNVLGFSTDADLSDGLSWTGWHTGPDGRAVAVIEGAHQAPFTGEQTKIPTSMIGLGGTLYLHYMSVHGFAAQGGVWECNFSQFVTSSDAGKTWQPMGGHVGEQGSNFNMLALSGDAGGGNAGGTYVYALGTPCGRFGDAQLARVKPATLSDVSTWEYFAGRAADGAALWDKNPLKAVDVVPGPVGEASLVWNAYLGRWTYSYLNEQTASLELRQAEQPWGPWSEPRVLATASDYPQLYGAFTTAAMLRGNGQTMYFVMSRFGPYNTFLMRADLSK
ncbi:DUF4185 domain-containing protein (plasmid) [Deinococcus metallilatus]|uniref:DUF4185 domain-containing protein n=1 Tax=Deinococcus metallilatus TaxID=1211322 RepID=A0AAJ5K1J3_9DEIO|nr:DUF4185 domain-containing protein [Deinococcus metallilatus]MBB5293452.1 hypothetical protein [Deinococcus metallilatus]QBY06538.1 DUF4185 domain-containing protein [Deinococcus metallilatus]RXJ17881.1 DUF4185 domain-containing protein [Deinococcus metallilatus]TLK32153.1 DUF4185 domain-containing protein [Deinococcus metallilatus]